MAFVPATKKQARARVALFGPSGSGKTFTGLSLATALADGGPVGVIDTERGSASLYSDKFSFDVLELSSYEPDRYVQGIKEAEKAGYKALLIDSLSHAWSGAGGMLDQVDKISGSGNSFAAWRKVTPQHNALVDAILGSKMHVICTMRSKTEYVLETNERGKQVPRKIGLAPVMRDGVEYEFGLCIELSIEHVGTVTKSRCEELADKVVAKPGLEFGQQILKWVSGGAQSVPVPADPPQPQGQAKADPKPDLIAMSREEMTAAIGRVPEAVRTQCKPEEWQSWYKTIWVQAARSIQLPHEVGRISYKEWKNIAAKASEMVDQWIGTHCTGAVL